MKKPRAADRTVDMFTGKSKLDEVQAAATHEADVVQAERAPFTGVESEVDRWRETAFRGQEMTTEAFHGGDRAKHLESAKMTGYRVSMRDEWLYLEATYGAGTAARYQGLVATYDDLWLLLAALVRFGRKVDAEKLKAVLREAMRAP
jgi:hypothetical protein